MRLGNYTRLEEIKAELKNSLEDISLIISEEQERESLLENASDTIQEAIDVIDEILGL
jgi:uncharacterized protein YeeX (DUF496 family)